jgi:hypothetical protein
MHSDSLKINTAAKGISLMSTYELIEEAAKSPEDASRVAQEAWRGSAGRANAVYRALSEMPQAAVRLDVRNYALKFIERVGFGGPNIETLSNLLSYPAIEEEAVILRSICEKYSTTIAPAVIFISKGTPDSLVDQLAFKYGLGSTVKLTAQQIPQRDHMMKMLRNIFSSNCATWSNDRSALFISVPMIEGKFGDLKGIIDTIAEVPPYFFSALSFSGTRKDKEDVLYSSNSVVQRGILDYQLTGNHILDPKESEEALKAYMSSPDIPPDEKVITFDSLDQYAQRPTPVDKKELLSIMAKIPSSITFARALKAFIDGEFDDVEAITSNLNQAISSCQEIIEVINRNRWLKRADPRFVEFAKHLMGVDETLGMDRLERSRRRV